MSNGGAVTPDEAAEEQGTAVDLTPCPVPAPGLRSVKLDGSTVLFDRSRGLSHLLNASAALVWACLDGATSVDEVVEQVVTATGAARPQIEADVTRVVEEFASNGLFDDGNDTPATASSDPGRWDGPRERALGRRAWPEVRTPRRAGGTTFALRCDDPVVASTLDSVLACLPVAGAATHHISIVDRGARPAPEAEAPHAVDLRLYVDGEAFGRASSAQQAADQVLTRVNRLAIDHTPGRVLLHAGAVERAGKVVVIAGVSGRGKSTLTAAMVQAGWGYLSDEMVAIDPDTWRVEPFTKALDLSAGSLELLGLDADAGFTGYKHPIPPDRLGTTSTGGELTAIVLLLNAAPDENPDADPAGDLAVDGSSDPRAEGASAMLRPLAPVDAVIEVLRNTFDATMDMPNGLDHIAAMCQAVPTYAMARTDLASAVEAVVHATES